MGLTRFLVFSDLHLNCWKYGSTLTEHGLNSRLVDQVNVVGQMCDYAYDNNIREIYFCGDFFHTHGSIKSEVLVGAANVFNHFIFRNLQWQGVPGNHDMLDMKGRITSIAPWGGVFFTEPLTIGRTLAAPLTFIPFTEDPIALHDTLREEAKHNPGNIVFMHQGVQGVEVNSKGFVLKGEIFSPEMIPDETRHVFCGHYHSHKRVSEKLTIPGSPMQFDWSDEGEQRGWLDVTIKDNDPGIEIKLIPSTAPRFVSFPDYEKVDSSSVAENFVRVYMNKEGDVSAMVEHLEALGARSTEFITRPNESESIPASRQDFNPQSLFQEWIETQDLESETVEIGKKIIDNSYEAPPV